MGNLDTRVILAGQPLNVLGALGGAAQAADAVNAVKRGNALADLYRTQGQGILAGDQSALNALAGLDPNAALGVQQTQLGMQATRQNMELSREQLEQIRFNMKSAMEEKIAKEGAAAAAAEAEQMQRMIQASFGAKTEEQLQAFLQQNAPDLVGKVTLANRDMLAASLMDGMSDAMEMAQGPEQDFGVIDGHFYDKNNPAAGAQPVPGLPQKDSNGVSMTMPDGTRVQVGGSNKPADKLDVSGPGYMLDTINGILTDTALDTSTGLLEWKQAIPGTDAYRFGTRVKQLQGQAFLQAFESLKGGGQITEIEGQKATQAIARIDSGMKADDFRDAMKELKDILGRAMNRPRGWADTSAGKISAMSADEIGSLDLINLNEEERAAARQRLQDLISEELDG